MTKIDIYEPEMRCTDGSCGITPDLDVARIDSMVASFYEDGYDIVRHNLTMDPNGFLENLEVGKLLAEKGNGILPITTVNGKIVKMREYPTALEFAKWFAGQF